MATKVLEINVDDIGYGGVFVLVKNILSYKSKDISMDIASLERFEKEENRKELEKSGCRVFYVGYSGNKLIKQFYIYRQLGDLLKKEHYDCVHIHADVANKLLVSGLAAKKAGVPRIMLHSHASGTDGERRKLKNLIHQMCRRFLKYIGTDFITCSDKAAEWMFPNISKKDIIMLKNGIDLERFRFSKKERKILRQEMNLEKAFVIGHVGRFAYQKNHEYLVKIFAGVKKQIPHAKLLLVGEGKRKEKIRQQADKLGIAEDVIFYGLTEQVQKLFWVMDVFVLPSHFEGLPIVGVEAQAAGLPVIFSNKITKEAKIADYVYFLPIEEAAVEKWCEQLKAMQESQREDAYLILKEKGFCIRDSVKQLETLYKRGI